MKCRPTYEVEARQITADNMDEIVGWCEGQAYEVFTWAVTGGWVATGQRRIAFGAESGFGAEVGDWMVHDPGTTTFDPFASYSDAEFRARYEPASRDVVLGSGYEAGS